MATTDEAAAAGGQHRGRTEAEAAQGAAGNQRRRQRHQEVQEVIDELAIETKRVTLLEREEQQLKGKTHVSRLLFAFGIGDEKKMQVQVEQEFLQWQSKQEEADGKVTGVLFFLGQVAVSFLEGPADQLFKALELFQGLTVEVSQTGTQPSSPADGKSGVEQKSRKESMSQANVPRLALIGALRILYFTELHGVRVSAGWCSFTNTGKSTGGVQVTDDSAHEAVFLLYKKILMVCMKVKDSAGAEADPDRLQQQYRRFSDGVPAQDEVSQFLAKQIVETFFNFQEFQKVFMKPFQLVLNSELLWPMPPALSY
jgi:transposase